MFSGLDEDGIRGLENMLADNVLTKAVNYSISPCYRV